MRMAFLSFSNRHELYTIFSKGILGALFSLNFIFMIIVVTVAVDNFKGTDIEESQASSSIKGGDFHVFYLASQIAAKDDYSGLYTLDKFMLERGKEYETKPDETFYFNYPPTALLLFSPLSKLDYDTSLYLWLAAGVIGFVMITQAVIKNWFITMLASLSPFIVLGSMTGQTGLFSAIILTSGYIAIERNKPLLAGLILGCLIFKPHLALALPFCFLATKDWKVIIGGIASSLLIILISYGVFGAEAWSEFVTNFSNNNTVTLLAKNDIYDRIPTVYLTLLGLIKSKTVAITLHIIVAVLAIFACVSIWRTSHDRIARLICLFITPALISPYFFDYDLAGVGILFGLMALETIRKPNLDLHFLALLGVWGMGLSISLTRLNGLSLGPVFLICLMGYALLRAHTQKKAQIT